MLDGLSDHRIVQDYRTQNYALAVLTAGQRFL